MKISHAFRKKTLPHDALLGSVPGLVQQELLKNHVQSLAYPRHYVAESQRNRQTREYIADHLSTLGYKVSMQGDYRNVLAQSPRLPTRPLHMVGAHYDSVPGSPGADDNASAIAAMLQCAAVMASMDQRLNCAFMAFNCEEDHLIGSRDFVQYLQTCQPFALSHIDVLEMLGYRDLRPRSQLLPRSLPVRIPDTGDFLGLVANKRSNKLLDTVLELAHTYLPQHSVIGLKICAGLERFMPHIKRSDHAPFWESGYSAIMWTDTAEFRNPHYHKASDTPDTLDYGFLQDNTALLCMHLLWSLRSHS